MGDLGYIRALWIADLMFHLSLMPAGRCEWLMQADFDRLTTETVLRCVCVHKVPYSLFAFIVALGPTPSVFQPQPSDL